MAISFDGSFEVEQDREKVFEFLTDPDRFCPLLPDYQSHAVEDDNHFNVKVKVGISHIRGTAAMKLQLAESVRPQRAVYKGNGSVAGGNVSVCTGSTQRSGANSIRGARSSIAFVAAICVAISSSRSVAVSARSRRIGSTGGGTLTRRSCHSISTSRGRANESRSFSVLAGATASTERGSRATKNSVRKRTGNIGGVVRSPAAVH